MSDDIEDIGPEAEAPAPKKKGKKKIVMLLGALIVLGGGAGGGLYAAGIIGGGGAHAVDDGKPKLVPKSGQKRAGAEGEGGEGGEGGASEGRPSTGGEKYASNYFKLDKDFTSNLRDSDRFIQVGVAIATHYDDTVIENIRTNDLAVRSAVLMALGDTGEDDIVDAAGKEKLAARLVKSINAVLQQKEGFGGVGNVYFTNFVVQ